MVSKIKKIVQSKNIYFTSLSISLAFLLSRILGLIRDRLISANFAGNPLHTDAYVVAFRLPDLIFTILVSGSLTVAFMPVFNNIKDDHKRSELINSLLTVFLFFVTGLSLLAIVFAQPLVHILSPGFSGEQLNITVRLSQIMMITPVCFALSSLFGSLQQSKMRFFPDSLTGFFYNIGIIIGILFLSKFFAPNNIYGLAWGVSLGALTQAVIQYFGLYGLGFKLNIISLRSAISNKDLIKVIRLMIPRSIHMGIDQITWTVEAAIGSLLVAGSLTNYYFANNLRNVPQGIIGGALSIAIFPTLLHAASISKDKLQDVFNKNIVFLAIMTMPAGAITFIMRGYLARILLGFSSPETADLLALLIPAFVAQSFFYMINRLFYCYEDTKTPTITAIVFIGINIPISLILVQFYAIYGLAMALSISSILQLILIIALMRRKISITIHRDSYLTFLKSIVASVIMTAAMWFMIRYIFVLNAFDTGFVSLIPKFIAVNIFGIFVYISMLLLLRVSEVHHFYSKLKNQIIGK